MSNKVIIYQTPTDVRVFGSIKELMHDEKPKIGGKLLSKWQIYRKFNAAKALDLPLEFDKGKIMERHIKRAKNENKF